MHSIARTTIAALLAGALGFSGAGLASAQETSLQVDIAATTTGRINAFPLRPERINDLRQEAQERIKNLREGMKETRIDIRADIRTASTSDERRGIIRDAIETRTEMRDRIQDRVAEIRGTLRDRIQALAQTHLGSIMRRADNALNMFDNLIERIESRIEKLQDRGADTASVEASLRASVVLVGAAKADRDALARLVASVGADATADEVRAELRTGVRALTSSIKAAHSALLQTARELVQLSVSVRAEANVQATTGN